jgi:hypothetical protein
VGEHGVVNGLVLTGKIFTGKSMVSAEDFPLKHGFFNNTHSSSQHP